MSKTRHVRGYDVAAADRYLSKADPQLAKWIKRIAPLDVTSGWKKSFDPVDALARAILYQQLSGKAASTIVGRLEAAIGSQRLHCETLSVIDDAGLRACGVSGNKALALRDLMRREANGEIPGTRRMAGMDNEEIIASLVPIRGIGRWTVEMMLMSRLGRPDVLPVDDLGIRRGIQILRSLAEMPKPKEAALLGEHWGPWRTHASFYLWRISDSATPEKVPVKRSQN